MTKERLDLLRTAIEGARSVVILPHNDPDPDAIASAVALNYLLAGVSGIGAQITYKGIIGRTENKALVRYLDHPLRMMALARVASRATVRTMSAANRISRPDSKVRPSFNKLPNLLIRANDDADLGALWAYAVS